MAGQPKIKIPFTSIDIILEGLAVAILLLLWAYVINEFGDLPDTIPTHFNAAGEVDDYGSKSTIFILPAVVTGVYLLLFMLQFFPNRFNYPIKAITASNAEFQYRNSLTMMRVLKIGIGFFFLLTTHEIIRIVKGKEQFMGPYFWVWLGLLIFLPIGFFLIRAIKSNAK